MIDSRLVLVGGSNANPLPLRRSVPVSSLGASDALLRS